MKRTSLKLLVFFISFFTLSTAYAQTSMLHGSVLNQKENIIDYAEVLLLSTDTTFIKGTVVNPEGHYTMNVTPGKYFLRLDNILSSHIRGEINARNFKSHFNHTVYYPTVSLSVSYILGAKLSAKRISRTDIQRRLN